MSRIATIQHPVPARFVPKGSRKERFAFVQGSTPVALREADEARFDFLLAHKDALGRETALHAFEERVWIKLNGWAPGNGLPDFTRDTFLDYLAGRLPPERARLSDLHKSLYRTPLCAALDVPQEPVGGQLEDFGWLRPFTRGDDVDLPSARKVVEEGSAEAAAAVRDFAAGNIVLTEGSVFVRCPGPLVLPFKMGHNVDYLALSVFPRHEWTFQNGVRLDHADALRDVNQLGAYLGLHPVPESEELIARAQAVIDPSLLGDDDLAVFINAAPQALARHVAATLAASKLDPEAHGIPQMRAGLAEMERLALRGRTGSVPLDEALPVLLRMKDLFDRVTHVFTWEGNWPQVRQYRHYFDRFALPRLQAAQQLSADDADAISDIALGLAP